MEDQLPVLEVKWTYGNELTLRQGDEMHRLITYYTHHFAFGMHDLGRHTTHQRRLDLTDSKPVFCPRHQLSRVEWDIIDCKEDEVAQFGLIELATGNHNGLLGVQP